jgi:hypothetical protein
MSQLIDRVRDGSVIAAPVAPVPRATFAQFGEPSGTKH